MPAPKTYRRMERTGQEERGGACEFCTFDALSLRLDQFRSIQAGNHTEKINARFPHTEATRNASTNGEMLQFTSDQYYTISFQLESAGFSQ